MGVDGAKRRGELANTTKGFDLGGNLPSMPSFGGFGSRFLRLLGLILLVILVFSSVVSIPTGHVGVMTLFGRVTGEALGEGIHLINPLKGLTMNWAAAHELATSYAGFRLVTILTTPI